MSSAGELMRIIDARIERAIRMHRGASRSVLEAIDASTLAPAADVEALADERMPVELFQDFGFRSIPPVNAELIVLQIGGRGGHMVAVASADRATAPTDLVSGDAAIYSSTGARVLVKADGTIEVTTPSGGVIEMDAAGGVTINGGTMGVARIGDAVTVTGVDSLGSAITASGTISGGSATVKAG